MSVPDEAARQSAAALALRPLAGFSAGVAVTCALALLASAPGPGPLRVALLPLGIVCALLGLGSRGRARVALLLVAGVGLGAHRGLGERDEELDLARFMPPAADATLRVEVEVQGGWEPSRWGQRARVSPRLARRRDETVRLPATVPLEVRGDVAGADLPPPGAAVEVFASLRGSPSRPLLVAQSPRLLQVLAPPRGLHRLRQRLVDDLLVAAGTEPRTIRAAELAAALALGRRDLVPRDQRDGWRRSGLAHMLAVSGLHVGLAGGAVWITLMVAGAGPRAARTLLLLVLPGYALLAGGAPSALRAALMGMTYLGARMLGRAVVPLAAVLLAATAMLLASPRLVADPGFQLTVVVTAALVRWVGPVAERIPGPRPVAAAVAVPVVAQLAAAPLVATHFRSVIPGAALANLAVPLLLTPALFAAVLATAVAPVAPALARPLLDLLGLLAAGLWQAAAFARQAEVVLPPLPVTAALAFAVAGALAVLPWRAGRCGAAAWLLLLATGAGWCLARPQPTATGATLLPVRDGLSLLAVDGHSRVLVDGGRFPREAVELLAEHGVRRLDAVVASHGEEDHIGGLAAVVRHLRVGRLVIPAQASADPAMADLLRSARDRGVPVTPVTRGSAVTVNGSRLEVLWPPARGYPRDRNESSLVARLLLGNGSVLVTSDIGAPVERRLARSSFLWCNVLVLPHHGSRGSNTPAFLAAARPQVALIPAGTAVAHRHPHPEVVERVRRLGLPYRVPSQEGWCGARPDPSGRWRPWP